MIEIKEASDCCGCTACASVCPHGAISMEPDVLGFLYPKVDRNRCVDCGLCEKVCAFNAQYDKSLNLVQPLAFAARHKDVNEIMKSRSGAVFAAISDYVLENNGVVYGVGYKDHFRVAHKRAVTKDERDEFRGSKYVQSDLAGIFCQVKEDLQDNRMVLFSGTPCQTAGLHSFISKRLRGNLLLVDIVCHGVPGPYIWRDFIAYLEKKQKDRIEYVNFRDKELFGWNSHRETFKFTHSGIKKKTFNFSFYNPFMFRSSCNNCHFANTIRPSDITLADFWGWNKHIEYSINVDNKGVSLVVINTEKGKEIWNKTQKELNTVSVNLNNCLQPNMLHPTEEHKDRKGFEELYCKKGFEVAMRRYGNTRIKRIKQFIKRFCFAKYVIR